MTSLSTLSVNAVVPWTTYTVSTAHKNNESVKSAVNLGDLEESGVIMQVGDQGSTSGAQTYNFTLGQNDSAYLQLSFNNVVDAASTQIQILDSQGNVIGDNMGTAEQQAVYQQITTTGYAPGAGNYTLQVTPAGGAGAPDVSIGAIQQQGTSLSAQGTLTSGDPTQYYNFSMANSNNIKLAFDAGNNNSSTRVQLLDSTGNVIADNRGSASLQNAFNQLTSGTGITANPGNYTVEVSYAPNTGTPNANYNFQLYSGNNYSVVYQTNTTPAAGNTTAESSVTPTSDAQSYGRQDYNTIGETAQSAVPIGWLQQNKTALSLTSLLTPLDSTDYYSFVLQQGSNNLKLSLNNLTNKTDTTSLHVQLLDSSGGQIIADNQGTDAQKAAYAQLTSATGLTAVPGSYVVKTTYAQGANKNSNLEYNFNLYSGTSYSSIYNTTASAQNYENAVLSGNLGGGYSLFVATASYLNSAANGSAPDIMSTLQSLA